MSNMVLRDASASNKHMEKDLKCDLCEYKTAFRAELNKHIRRVHEGLEYSCGACDWSSKWKQALKKHILIKHIGHRIQCNDTTKKGLDKHVKRIHQVSFCNVCDFKSSSKPEFIKHQNLHKLQCKQCDYVASRAGNMKIHIQAIHDQVTYPCKVCPYK